jgi:hypothetical protein
MIIWKVTAVLFYTVAYTVDTYGVFNYKIVHKDSLVQQLALRGGMYEQSFTGLQEDGQFGSILDRSEITREGTSEPKGFSLAMVNASIDSALTMEQGELSTDVVSGLPLNASDERNLLRLQLRVAQVNAEQLQESKNEFERNFGGIPT